MSNALFDKILIANRGEIACRVIKTAHRLGIKTVAVYSDADRHAQHVQMADEAIYIGASSAKESYLDGPKIIAAALSTGAQAIHPGYGFLSENTHFCQLCKDNNIVFIGPSASAIEAMGSKSAAKRLMDKAGVPLIPGYHGENQDPDFLKQQADAMGYPVLLKAVAGGGGKGMRQVYSSDEFHSALAAAKREATNSFGNDDMLIEKYLTQPRHVEIQVFRDQLGNGVYLFERDCSVQRRHQKVIEEAPAPGLAADIRSAMGDAALRAAEAIEYYGAGTIEFLLDFDNSFYFMEMNTRLQVEHPVTEMITGQDLVEWQLIVASKQPLPLQQNELSINGHAFEARIYAEDPDQDFLPQTGLLHFLKPPHTSGHVRVDTGVVEGDEVSIYYDPMIAKLIVWDIDRNRALNRLSNALREYRIGGLKTNIEFLSNLISVEAFKNAELDTGFIAKHYDSIFNKPSNAFVSLRHLAALSLAVKQKDHSIGQSFSSPWHAANAWRLNEPHCQKFALQDNTGPFIATIEYIHGGEAGYRINIDEQCITAQAKRIDDTLQVNIDGYKFNADIFFHENGSTLFYHSGSYNFNLQSPDLGDDNQHDNHALEAPMNGTIVALLVQPGEHVCKGQGLLIMEAMKMEHTIKAPQDGILVDFKHTPGALVSAGEDLVVFETVENL